MMKRPEKNEVTKQPPLVDAASLVGSNYASAAKVGKQLNLLPKHVSFQTANEYRNKTKAKNNDVVSLREKPSSQAVLNNTFDMRMRNNDSKVENVRLTKKMMINRMFQKLKPYLCAQNNTAPTVAFRKTKRQKNKSVDDVVFVNLLNQVRFIAEHFRHNELEGEVG